VTLLALLGAGATCAVSPAAAQAPAAATARLALEWDAPAGCPDRGAVLTQVAGLLQGSDSSADPSLVAVRATVTSSTEAAWQLRLETSRAGATGERHLEGGSCAALVDAAALILAWLLDPEALARPDEARDGEGRDPIVVTSADRGGGATAQAARLDAPDARPLRERAPRRRGEVARSIGAQVRVAGVADVGSLPAVGFGVEAVAALSTGRLRWELAVVHLFERRATLENRSAGGDIDLTAGSLGVCHASVRAGDVDLGPCGAIEIGALDGRGFGVETPGEGGAWWIAPRVGAMASWHVSSALALGLDASIAIPISRPRFLLTNVGDVYTPSPITARLGASLGLSF